MLFAAFSKRCGLPFLHGRLACLLIWTLLTGCGGRSTAPQTRNPVAAVPAVTFADITARAGLHFQHVNGATGKKWLPETMGSGCAFLDYDNDGWQDILLLNGDTWDAAHGKHARMALYHNNHDGTFTDMTQEVGLDVPLFGMGIAVGDYDNDGYDDLFITAVGKSRLFHNVSNGRGGRKFTDVTATSGISDTGWGTSAAWLDYDRDGKLDLFVCHYVRWSPQTDAFASVDGTHKSYARPRDYPGESCRLYHNLGGGKFQDVTRQAGILNAHSKALAWPFAITTVTPGPISS